MFTAKGTGSPREAIPTEDEFTVKNSTNALKWLAGRENQQAWQAGSVRNPRAREKNREKSETDIK